MRIGVLCMTGSNVPANNLLIIQAQIAASVAWETGQ